MDLQSSLRISRVLHAGYLFEGVDEGITTQILFDPIFENPFSFNCYAYPPVKFDLQAIQKLSLSAIFISHYHDDHCSLESLQHLPRDTSVYVYCIHEELFGMLRQLGFVDVRALHVDCAEQIGPFRITPRRALDDSTDTLFEITAFDCKILNVVDAQIDIDTLEQLIIGSPWDLVLWPFQVMRESEVLSPTRSLITLVNTPESLKDSWPSEWTKQLQRLSPLAIVPSSCQFIHEEWSWYRSHFFSFSYAEFESFINMILPTTEVLRLNPGCSMVWEQKRFRKAEPLPWIHPIGRQDVDYTFQPTVEIPSTASIAMKLPPLTPAEKERVNEFCRTEMIKRYRQIGPPADIYFQKRRAWRLSVFDHLENAESFFYSLCDEDMIPTTDTIDDLAWTTEISAHKLYSALENGESLSSIYLRVNNSDAADILSAKVETELQDVNPLEDPLLRCLYNCDALSYQRAQLRRLLNS